MQNRNQYLDCLNFYCLKKMDTEQVTSTIFFQLQKLKITKNFFDQPVKIDQRTNNNIRKIKTNQGDDYTTGCLLDYDCLSFFFKIIAIDLSKQQALDTDPKAIQ